MRRTVIHLLALTACLWVGNSAQAAIVFEFGLGGASPTGTFTVGLGSTVPVQVYLRETETSILRDEGLFSTAVLVTTVDPTIADVLSADDIARNVAFDTDVMKDAVPGAATLSAAVFDPGLPYLTPDADGRILVGTFNFTGLALGTTAIGAEELDPDPGFADTVTGSGTVLDGQIGSALASITVVEPSNVIPEPTALIVWSVLGASGITLGWWRRRRRAES